MYLHVLIRTQQLQQVLHGTCTCGSDFTLSIQLFSHLPLLGGAWAERPNEVSSVRLNQLTMKYAFLLLALIFAGCGESSTNEGESVRDIDGNEYEIVKIGSQYWFKSNLKVSKYRNGESIPTGLNKSAWKRTTDGAYAVYEDEQKNDSLYGKLYNYYAVTDSRGLCPTGWHVPSDGEWNIMVKNLDPDADTACSECEQSSIAGGALKSTATQPTLGGWDSPNEGATNSSGFTALPGGLRLDDGGYFNTVASNGYWWSSSVSSGSNAWSRDLSSYGYSGILRYGYNRTYGFSVRCCRD